jgi:hypothetical protein
MSSTGRELKRCHEENSLFRQFFGVCNQLDWAMRDCTKVILSVVDSDPHGIETQYLVHTLCALSTSTCRY